jgi:hypothetical protein
VAFSLLPSRALREYDEEARNEDGVNARCAEQMLALRCHSTSAFVMQRVYDEAICNVQTDP